MSAEMRMDLLPTEMLLEVFSYLSVHQLLRVEDVCRRWKRAIQEKYWNQLKWISKETIGYPNGDCLNNLIRLSRRVVQVKGFVDPFRLTKTKTMLPRDLKMEAELRKATLMLTKKLSPNAAFPVGLIGSVVSSLFKTTKHATEWNSETPSMVAAMTGHIVREYGLYGFDSLHVDEMLIHSEKDDPFFIKFGQYGELEIPIPVEITRLNVGCLVMRLLWDELDGDEYGKQTYLIWTRLSMCERLESIDIARVCLFAREENDKPNYSIVLEFHEDRRQFGASEFLAMLDKLDEIAFWLRDLGVVHKVNEWFEHDRVKRVAMNIRSDFFMTPPDEELCRRGDDLWLDDRFNATMSNYTAIPLSCVDTLQLTHDVSRRQGNPFDAIKASGVLSQLKSLTISLIYSMQRTYRGLTNLAAFDTSEAVTEVEMILRAIKDSLRSLERLTLRFPAKGDHCPSSLFSVVDVAVPNVPLPHLLNLECTDLPCLPFIVSVVSQAPNLRRLSIDSKPFEDDSVAIQWISTLVDSVAACPRLQSLHITVSEKQLLNVLVESGCPMTRHVKKGQLKDGTELKDGLKELNARLEALSERSNLIHLAVKADGWQYSFSKERHQSFTETTENDH